MPNIPFNISELSGSGSSSGYNAFTNDNDEIEYHNPLVFLLLPLSPILLVGLVLLLSFFRILYNELCKKCKKCKNYKWTYDVWKESKNAPIFNGTLSSKYITTLNTNNHSKIDKKELLDCSICLEPINLEKFKLKKNDLVFLECGHV